MVKKKEVNIRNYFYVGIVAVIALTIIDVPIDTGDDQITGEFHGLRSRLFGSSYRNIFRSSCSNECSYVGAKVCSGNGFRTCGQYDRDRCLELSSVSSCSNGCTNGVCNSIPKCIDSDNGKNYNSSGTTTGLTRDEITQELKVGTKSDVCLNSMQVGEWYCKPHRTYGEYIEGTTYTCPNGCEKGACLEKPKPDYCKRIYSNFDNSNKVNIVFIPDSYDDINLWSGDVEDFMDLNGVNNGFFSVEPMKSNKNKFNIWRVDLLNDNFWDIEAGWVTGENMTRIKELASSCVKPDAIFLILDNKLSLLEFIGFGSYRNSIAFITRTSGNSVYKTLATRNLVHEFGHAFVNLGDEYENSRSTQDFSDIRPNIDIEGCPKWCSGELNEEATCYNEYIAFRDCLYSVTNNLTQRYNEECSYNWNLPNCNLGKSCKEETGCYWNAKSVTSFRSSQKSLIKYPDEDPFEFNLISREAILNKINLIVEGSS